MGRRIYESGAQGLDRVGPWMCVRELSRLEWCKENKLHVLLEIILLESQIYFSQLNQ